MGKMYYVESQNKRERELVDFLRKRGLDADPIESHYFYYKRFAHGELFMWYEGSKSVLFVHRSQEELVRACGERVEY